MRALLGFFLWVGAGRIISSLLVVYPMATLLTVFGEMQQQLGSACVCRAEKETAR